MGNSASTLSISLVIDNPPSEDMGKICRELAREFKTTFTFEEVGKKSVVRVRGATRDVLKARMALQKRCAQTGGLLRLK